MRSGNLLHTLLSGTDGFEQRGRFCAAGARTLAPLARLGSRGNAGSRSATAATSCAFSASAVSCASLQPLLLLQLRPRLPQLLHAPRGRRWAIVLVQPAAASTQLSRPAPARTQRPCALRELARRRLQLPHRAD